MTEISKSRRPFGKRLLLLAAMAALLLFGHACSGRQIKAEGPLSGELWRRQTLALTVEGYVFSGSGIQPQTWAGSGIWIGHGTLLTNAHVAMRAMRIEGADDLGRRFAFDTIAAIDPERDVAVLRASHAVETVETALLPRPDDPGSLRGQPVVAVGNVAGMGHNVYKGDVVNIVASDGTEIIFHNAGISGGASGGPLYLVRDSSLLGINNAVNNEIKLSLAIPTWSFRDLVQQSENRPGLPLGQVFEPSGLPTRLISGGRECISPGQAMQIPFVAIGPLDLALVVKPEGAEMEYLAGLVTMQQQVVAEGRFNQDSIGIFSLPAQGPFAMVIANPDMNGDDFCFEAGVVKIDWQQRMDDGGAR